MRKMYNLFKCIIKSGGILYEIYDKQMELVAESNDVTTLQSKIREEYQMWIKRKASGDMIYFDEIDYDKENNNYFAFIECACLNNGTVLQSDNAIVLF